MARGLARRGAAAALLDGSCEARSESNRRRELHKLACEPQTLRTTKCLGRAELVLRPLCIPLGKGAPRYRLTLNLAKASIARKSHEVRLSINLASLD